MDDLLSLPQWSLISTSEHQPVEHQPSACLSFLGIDDLVPVDAHSTQYAPALPFDHNPNHPPPSAFFDDIISQGLPGIDCSVFVPLTPSVVHPSDRSWQPAKIWIRTGSPNWRCSGSFKQKHESWRRNWHCKDHRSDDCHLSFTGISQMYPKHILIFHCFDLTSEFAFPPC